MINIAVCDDNAEQSARVEQMINNTVALKIPEEYDCRVCGVFNRAGEVLEYLENGKTDIIFLDIEMDEMNGFELASKLNEKYPDMIIIFVSAHENRVYSSFEYAPFRFLRKTQLENELEQALLASVEKVTSENGTLLLDTTEGQFRLLFKNVIYFESKGNYVITCVSDGREYRSRGTLDSLSRTLTDDFCRIHKGFIINLRNVRRIERSSLVTMSNGREIPVSARRSSVFKKAYLDYTSGRFSK